MGCEGEEAKGQRPRSVGSVEKSKGSRVTWEREGTEVPAWGGGLIGRMVGCRQRHSRGWIVGVGAESGKFLECYGVVLGRAGRDRAGSSEFGENAVGPTFLLVHVL